MELPTHASGDRPGDEYPKPVDRAAARLGSAPLNVDTTANGRRKKNRLGEKSSSQSDLITR